MATFIEVWDADEEEFVVINADWVVSFRATYAIDGTESCTARWSDTSTTTIGHPVETVMELVKAAGQ